MAGSRLLIGAAALTLLAAPALSQVATSSGSRVVVDPETRRARVINPALDRPDPFAGTAATTGEPERIILKKPRVKKARPAAPKPATAETPSPDPEPQHQPQHQPQAAAGSLGADDYVSPFDDAPAAPAPQKPAPKKPAQKPVEAPKPKAAPAAQPGSEIPFSFGGRDDYARPQQQKAQAAQPSSGNVVRGENGKTRNIRINFIAGAAEPSAEVATALQSLADSLTSELQAKPGRLLLQAYAGAKGDKSSDARRLSLKRALSVRQLLIDSGVPSDRIDVRAMGGASDGERLDRVDISLRG